MTKERSALPGTAPDAMAEGYSLDPGQDNASRTLLVRMLRVMFPHERFSDGPYERTADAVFNASGGTVAEKVSFAAALHDLNAAGFAKLDDKAAYKHLQSIEKTGFFQLVRSTAVVALYDDKEVWDALGYEGPSFDKGGYINRGFNDLDWLPDPRIEEYEAGQ